MDPISDGCRLCLDPDPFAGSFTTIDSPELKVQMEKVFSFSIEPKQGYCSGVCQSCAYAISEFYQYSEKVRQNQELLNGNATNCDSTADLAVDSKVEFESVKIETLSDSGLLDTTEDACDPKDEVSEEEGAPNSGDVEIDDPAPKTLQTKRKRRRGKIELSVLEPEEPTTNSKQATRSAQQKEREEEDQLFNKHFRMICDVCGTAEATFTKLARHFRTEHKRHYAYVVCCNKKLNSRCAIRDHIHFHANPDEIQCELCGLKYENKEILNEHMLLVHSSAGLFECDLCAQSFAQKSAIAKHMERHMTFKCPKCDKMLASKRSFTYHMTSLHSDKVRTMVCDTCGQTFRCKKAFNRHINEHVGIQVQQFQCKICQRRLKGEKNFRYHMNMVHGDGERKFQCDVCLKKYRNSQALYMHKLRTHGKLKQECEFCGKSFKHAISLREHRNIHTGEVLYACKYCGVSKNSRTCLFLHVKRHHPTERAQKKLMKNGVSENLPDQSIL